MGGCANKAQEDVWKVPLLKALGLLVWGNPYSELSLNPEMASHQAALLTCQTSSVAKVLTLILKASCHGNGS